MKVATVERRETKRRGVRYRALVRVTGYPPQSRTFKKRSTAAHWGAVTEEAMRKGSWDKFHEAEKRTVADMIDKYMNTVMETKSEKRRYIDQQRKQLTWWRKRLGDYRLVHATAGVIGEARDELMASPGRSGPTVNRYMSALSHVFKVAVNDWEWLPSSPMGSVRKYRENPGVVRYLTQKERDALLSACLKEESKPLFLIVVLAISTGARKGELLTMKWKHVDLERGAIVLTETKNSEQRQLFVRGLALQLLTRYAAHRHPRSDYVFPTRSGKQPIRIEREWNRARRRASLQDFRFHDLRHTAGSYLAMNKATTSELAEVLGHKSLEMVKRYAHMASSHTANVVESMNERFLGQGHHASV